MEEKTEQKAFAIPRIGEPAPEFKAITTQGEIKLPCRRPMNLISPLQLTGDREMM